MGPMIDMLPVPPKPATAKQGTEYRELTAEEIQTVAGVFTDRGAQLPDPATSSFIGAVEDGRVIGFLVLQLKLHAEPMWIEPGHSAVFAPLVHKAEEVILQRTGPQWVYLFAPAGRVSQMAVTMGMQIEPWVVMSKLVMPEAPQVPVVELLPMEVPEPEPFTDYPIDQSPASEAIQ